MKQKRIDDQIQKVIEWLERLEQEVGQAKALAAIAADSEFSNYARDVQTEYWNIFLNLMQHVQEKFKQMKKECRDLCVL